MKTSITFCLTLLAFSSIVSAYDMDLRLRIQPGHTQANNNSPFSYYQNGYTWSRQDLITEIHHNGWGLEWTGTQLLAEDYKPEYKGVINQAYKDTNIGNWELTIGKKKISWGVGTFYRPLDVLQNSPRRGLLPVIEEGLTLVSAERYFDSSSIGFVCGTEWKLNSESSRSGNNRCAIRWQTLMNDWELQGIAYADESTDYRVGFGISGIIGEALEIHSSAMYLHRYQKQMNTLLDSGQFLSTSDPMQYRDKEDGFRFLIGGTYTWTNNLSLSLEYWHDDSGYTKNEWEHLVSLTKIQQNLARLGVVPESLVKGNQLWSSQIFLQQNIMQDYLASHISYSFDETDITGYIIYSIQDKSRITTITAETEINDYNNLAFGARYFDGTDNSVYKNSPTKYQVYLSWTAIFDV